jgi:hypothetical protein
VMEMMLFEVACTLDKVVFSLSITWRGFPAILLLLGTVLEMFIAKVRDKPIPLLDDDPRRVF